MNFKKLFLPLGVILGFVAVAFAVSYPIAHDTWTGTGSRNRTVEFTLETPSEGAAAIFRPGTDNANSMGSTSTRWLADYLYVLDLASTGKLIRNPATVQSVAVVNTTVTPYPFTLIGSTGAVTLAGVPNIATTSITAGTDIIVKSTANVITITDQAVLTTSGLCLNANTVTITTSTPVHLIFDGTCWMMVR